MNDYGWKFRMPLLVVSMVLGGCFCRPISAEESPLGGKSGYFRIKSECDIEVIKDGETKSAPTRVNRSEFEKKIDWYSMGSRVKCAGPGKAEAIWVNKKMKNVSTPIGKEWVVVLGEIDTMLSAAIREVYARGGRAKAIGITWPPAKQAVAADFFSIIFSPPLELDAAQLVVGLKGARGKEIKIPLQGKVGHVQGDSLRAFLNAATEPDASRLAWVELRDSSGEAALRSDFILMSQTDQTSLKNELASLDSVDAGVRELMRAYVFMRRGLLDAAAEEYKSYLRQFSKDSIVSAKLTSLYETIGDVGAVSQ